GADHVAEGCGTSERVSPTRDLPPGHALRDAAGRRRDVRQAGSSSRRGVVGRGGLTSARGSLPVRMNRSASRARQATKINAVLGGGPGSGPSTSGPSAEPRNRAPRGDSEGASQRGTSEERTERGAEESSNARRQRGSIAARDEGGADRARSRGIEHREATAREHRSEGRARSGPSAEPRSRAQPCFSGHTPRFQRTYS